MQTADESLQGYRARWLLAEPIPPELREHAPSVMLAHLLWCRGYRTAEEIDAFFTRGTVSHEPSLLPDMDHAVERISAAIEGSERIAIYGDFDCDGITASAVLAETFRNLGVEAEVVIPTREEGHGLHTERLAALADRGVNLIVTADGGITAMEEVQVALGMGMDVVVTDHHEPRLDGSLPACPTVAPTRLDSAYPCRFLSGVGVAYKLVQALARRFPGRFAPEEVLDLVALGTVADVVPLRDENRSLVVLGLSCLKGTTRLGLQALFRAAGVDPARIDPTAIGFYLAPRINAANRVAVPQTAYDLITATDRVVAETLASELQSLNIQRQALLAETVERVVEDLGAPPTILDEVLSGARPPVLVVLGDWPPGISGLLANRLVDVYGLPAFVGTESESGVVAVSARGTRTAPIDLLIESCEASEPGGLFLGYGGHARAGGFRVEDTRLEAARALLESQARAHVPVDEIGSVLNVDAEVRLAQLTPEAARRVRSLAPFGIEFPEPLFLSRDVEVRAVRAMGDGSHARLTVQQGVTRLSAVAFKAPKELLALQPGTRLDIVFNLQIDDWNEMQRVQLCVQDWRVISD